MKYKPISIIFTEQFVTSLLSHMCAKTNNQGLLNWHKYMTRSQKWLKCGTQILVIRLINPTPDTTFRNHSSSLLDYCACPVKNDGSITCFWFVSSHYIFSESWYLTTCWQISRCSGLVCLTIILRKKQTLEGYSHEKVALLLLWSELLLCC